METITKAEFEAAIIGAAVIVRAGWDINKGAEVLYGIAQEIPELEHLDKGDCLQLIKEELAK